MHNNNQQDVLEEGNEVTFSVLSEQSLYSLYRIEISKIKYVAKVYPACKAGLYQQELDLLERITHPNIIKPFNPNSSLSAKLAAIFKSELILFPEAAYGSLLNYIVEKGPVSERILRYFLKQIISGLLHVEQQIGMTHPNLILENVLMDQTRNLLICGWSNSLQYKREVHIALAEMAMSLLIGRSPFVCKNLKVDQYGKFLTEKLIYKFWQQSEKFSRRINSQFKFSQEFKTVIGSMFLGKLVKLEQIIEIYLKEGMISLQEAQKELEEFEKEAAKQRRKRQNDQQKQQKNEQKCLQQNENLMLARQPSRSVVGTFLDEYNLLKQQKPIILPSRSDSDKRPYFQLFDNDLKVVLAHLRAKLAQACFNQKQGEWFVDPLLILKSQWEAEIIGSQLNIQLPFGWDLNEFESSKGLTNVSIQVTLSLAREKETLLGAFAGLECDDLQPVCGKWVVHWLKDTLQFYA